MLKTSNLNRFDTAVAMIKNISNLFQLTGLVVILSVIFTKCLGYNYVSIYAKRFILLCVAIINAVLIGVNKNNSYICSIIIVATGRCF